MMQTAVQDFVRCRVPGGSPSGLQARLGARGKAGVLLLARSETGSPGMGGDPSWAQAPTLNSFGTFSTPSFAGVGEPYSDKHKGVQRQPREISLSTPLICAAARLQPTAEPRADSSRQTSRERVRRVTTGTRASGARSTGIGSLRCARCATALLPMGTWFERCT